MTKTGKEQPKLVVSQGSRTRAELPRSPDADDERVRAAEKAGNVTDPRYANIPEESAEPPTGRSRRRRKKVEIDTVYIRGPKPVIDALARYKEEQNFRNNWGALEDLLLQAGIQIEDFDV